MTLLNGNTLRDAILSGANHIANNRQKVDELNVFPVPDGDTGTNMSMTIGNGAREIVRLQDETAEAVSDAAASALLRGARGNSGVILSLLFRGIAKGLKGCETVDGPHLADALGQGVEAAYKAVMKPTEGTILTVARVAAETARASAQEGKDTVAVFEDALSGAREALAQTASGFKEGRRGGRGWPGPGDHLRGHAFGLQGQYSDRPHRPGARADRRAPQRCGGV